MGVNASSAATEEEEEEALEEAVEEAGKPPAVEMGWKLRMISEVVLYIYMCVCIDIMLYNIKKSCLINYLHNMYIMLAIG